MTYSPKDPRIRKAKYTTQDVRKQALEARDELLANVDFLMEAIREDRVRLQRYKDKFGDLKFRPIVRPASTDGSIEPQYGAPTDMNLEPLANVYRASINSLLQSIRLIQEELIPEEDAEGDISTPNDSTPKVNLRESFTNNIQAGKALEPELDEDAEERSAEDKRGLATTKKSTKLVDIKAQAPKPPNKPAITPITRTEPVSTPKLREQTNIPSPKPWRTTAQSTLVKTQEPRPDELHIETKSTKPRILQNPNKLDPESERLRNELLGLRGGGRLKALADKYGEEERSDDDET